MKPTAEEFMKKVYEMERRKLEEEWERQKYRQLAQGEKKKENQKPQDDIMYDKYLQALQEIKEAMS